MKNGQEELLVLRGNPESYTSNADLIFWGHEVHATDFLPVKVGSVGGTLVFDEDLTVVVELDQKVLPTDFGILVKMPEAGSASDVDESLLERDVLCLAVFIGDLHRDGA